MRILVDECLPRQLKAWLGQEHEVTTVQDQGWANVKNGRLLKAADSAQFDVFLTADKNMYYQQNFAGMRLSALVIPSNRKLHVEHAVLAVRQSLGRIVPGQKVIMELGPNPDRWGQLELVDILAGEQHTTHIFRPRISD